MAMRFADYFLPIPKEVFPYKTSIEAATLGDTMKVYIDEFPDWKTSDIVICSSQTENISKQSFAHLIRKKLYTLSIPKRNIRISDLGELKLQEVADQQHQVTAQVFQEIIKAGKLLIILSDSQEITYKQYLAYENLSSFVEYVSIDSKLDLQDSDFGLNDKSYNHKIFLHTPNYLGNFTNLGIQAHFKSIADHKRMDNLHFESYRFGDLRQNLREAEPPLRNANMTSIDLAAVRSADAPGVKEPWPVGFSAEEICQLARYVSMGNRLSSVSLSGYCPHNDINEQTAGLTALITWYLIEGFYSRRIEEPDDLSQYIKYSVSLHDGAEHLTFYKNPRTEQWWMEVPYPNSIGNIKPETELVPCSETDFRRAQQDEIPNRWWQAHYRLA